MSENILHDYMRECRKFGIQSLCVSGLGNDIEIQVECLSDKTPEYDKMTTMNLYDEDELIIRYSRMLRYSYLNFENVKLEILKYT